MIGITLMIVSMCLGIYLFNKKDFRGQNMKLSMYNIETKTKRWIVDF